MKTLQEILMEDAKARGAVEQGTDQLSEIDNADFAGYVPPGLPKIEKPTSIPLTEGTTYAELAKEQAGGDFMAKAIAEANEQAPVPAVNRAPASSAPKAPSSNQGQQESQGPQPKGIGERLEDLMKERNAAYAEAEKNQRRQELIGSLAGNLGNIIGGAQAMNTGASVTPAKTGFKGQDLTTGVDKRYKPELDSMLGQYKSLQAAKARQASLANADRNYNLQLAKFNQDERFYNRAQGGREDAKEQLKYERGEKHKQDLSDRIVKSGLSSIQKPIEALELKLGMTLEEALEKNIDIPGFGEVNSLVPDIMIPDNDREYRQLVSKLENPAISEAYGASQTSGEVGRRSREAGTGKMESDKTLLRHLVSLKNAYNTDLQKIYAGSDKAIVEKYKKDTGIVDFADKAKKSAPTSSQPKVGDIVTSGGVNYRVINDNGDVEEVK